jgi:alkaline phosphatase D
MNLKNWAKRALVVVSVAASLAAAGNARADSVVSTHAQGSDKSPVTTAPRSPTAAVGNTTLKPASSAPFAVRDVSTSSSARSGDGELRKKGSAWWLLVIAGLLVSLGIGLRVVEAWRRMPSVRTAPDPRPRRARTVGVLLADGPATPEEPLMHHDRTRPRSAPDSLAFVHGVASGDPLADRVVLWTRISGTSGDVSVEWVIAGDPDLQRVVRSGTASTGPEHDWTVHVDVDGLDAATTYHYGFRARGRHSPVGRTRTLPSGSVDHLRLAMVSCAKFNAGFFNAYARIAERDDLDFVLHLGDYIYEASNTPPKSQTPGADIGRPFEPRHECRTLEDYRARYAQYRRDPDLQALHRAHVVVATLDDHELADGAWAGGATEHRAERDGPWADRRRAALRARREWLPTRPPDPQHPERVYRAVRVGDLADLLLLDVRSFRHEPVAGPAMHEADRSMLGADQWTWLHDELGASRATWRVVASPSPFAPTWRPDLPLALHGPMRALKLMHPVEDACDEDQWDGYPAERARLLRRIAETGRALVLAGDLHVAMAVEHTHPDDGDPVCVEVVTPSVTSQNLDEKLRWTPRGEAARAFEDDFVAALPGWRWCELESHGYTVVDLSAERAVIEWWFVDTVLERCVGERLGRHMIVAADDPRAADVTGSRPELLAAAPA